jgi:hypothetical protein
MKSKRTKTPSTFKSATTSAFTFIGAATARNVSAMRKESGIVLEDGSELKGKVNNAVNVAIEMIPSMSSDLKRSAGDFNHLLNNKELHGALTRSLSKINNPSIFKLIERFGESLYLIDHIHMMESHRRSFKDTMEYFASKKGVNQQFNRPIVISAKSLIGILRVVPCFIIRFNLKLCSKSTTDENIDKVFRMCSNATEGWWVIGFVLYNADKFAELLYQKWQTGLLNLYTDGVNFKALYLNFSIYDVYRKFSSMKLINMSIRDAAAVGCLFTDALTYKMPGTSESANTFDAIIHDNTQHHRWNGNCYESTTGEKSNTPDWMNIWLISKLLME